MSQRTIDTVVITRPAGLHPGADSLTPNIEALGLRALVLPVLRCELVELSAGDEAHVRACIERECAWIAFLSPNAVRALHRLCSDRLGYESAHGVVHLPETMKMAVQGVGTAKALAECFGRHPDFMPSVYVAEEFGHEFAAAARHAAQPQQAKVFIPQSTQGRGVLAPVLRSHGYEVVSVDIYHTRELSLSDELRGLVSHLDPTTTVFVFMSPSAVRATVQQLAQQRALLEAAAIVSVGPITSQAVRSAGLVVTAEAASHSEQGIVELLKP